VVVSTIFVGGAISLWSVTVGIAVISVALLGLPISTGIAIARYRLYDIDLLINRTLVYGSLTAMLALVYVSPSLCGCCLLVATSKAARAVEAIGPRTKFRLGL
jgi:hypothetical protein